MISSRLRSRRASPSANPTIRSRAAASKPSSGSAFAAARSNSVASSSALSGCRTYTAARERSAELTSNDGFSVVAPTKVTSPCSTYGRKASCCALLKRCTSSTNRIVERPLRARTSRACWTASRMSLTPEKTADSAMNSALNASAISRAIVVLPEPGGPQRIIECGLPDSKASRSGLPGPRRCACPTTSSSTRGRSASASGATGFGAAKRSLTCRQRRRRPWAARNGKAPDRCVGCVAAR